MIICPSKEALQLFAENRTDLRHGKAYQGVETPSQTRYVGYYEKILHVYNHQIPPARVLKLKSITITAIASKSIGFSFSERDRFASFISISGW